jgi:drug/metabolite transporter (DMT)-like permease
LVYPMTRGIGVFLVTICAIGFLGERPSVLALGGICMILTGVFVLTSCADKNRTEMESSPKPYLLVLGCGITIAIYTLWDKIAVSSLNLPPLLISWFQNFSLFVLLFPFVYRQRSKALKIWKVSWREAIGVGVLCPLSYILILIAMTYLPVSYIAPCRELSILVGAFLGTKCLDEGAPARRMLGAGVMVTGIFALAMG